MKLEDPNVLWFAEDPGVAAWAVLACGDLPLLFELNYSAPQTLVCFSFITPCCGALFSHRKTQGICNACGRDWAQADAVWPNQGQEAAWQDGEQLPRTILFDRDFAMEDDARRHIPLWLERLGADPLEVEVGACLLTTLPYDSYLPPSGLPPIKASNMAYQLEKFYKFDVLKKTGAYHG